MRFSYSTYPSVSRPLGRPLSLSLRDLDSRSLPCWYGGTLSTSLSCLMTTSCGLPVACFPRRSSGISIPFWTVGPSWGNLVAWEDERHALIVCCIVRTNAKFEKTSLQSQGRGDD